MKILKKISGNSFLRWAGSKRQLIPILSEFWQPSHKRYVEPFAGSAALFFHLSPKKALLGDINYELISTYKQVKDDLQGVLDCIALLRKNKKIYLQLRAQDPTKMLPSERAARFIYLNRYCFNGLYRTNKSGIFNVPYSGNSTGAIPAHAHFESCAMKLSCAKLVCGSFEKTLKKSRQGDFIYMDPPYTVRGKRVFNGYNQAIFDDASLLKLREWMLLLDDVHISFLVSYACSEEADFLSQGFNVRRVTTKRNIAGFTGSRRIDNEILIYNQ